MSLRYALPVDSVQERDHGLANIRKETGEKILRLGGPIVRIYWLTISALVGCASQPAENLCSLPALHGTKVAEIARDHLRKHGVLEEEWLLNWESNVRPLECSYVYLTAPRLNSFDPGVSVVVNRRGEVEDVASEY